MEKVALENAKTAAESTASKKTTAEPAAICQTILEGPVPVMQPVQIVERPLGPLKTIMDTELERSCVERSERVLADKATADSSTAERKVRQWVEQRLKKRKQLKVQNWRGRSMRWSHVSDDDSKRQAVKSNDFLYIGQLKLTVTVSPVQGSSQV